MNNLEQFADRGLKAQQNVNLLVKIAGSEDLSFLRRLMGDRDQPANVRQAAERRLKKLVRKPRL